MRIRTPPSYDAGGPLTRRIVQTALVLLISVYAYLRAWALADYMPDLYRFSFSTVVIRVLDFLAGGALFFLIADVYTHSHSEPEAKNLVEFCKKTGALEVRKILKS